MGIEYGLSDQSPVGDAMSQNSMIKKFIPVLIIAFLIGLILSPRYLVYADPPKKTDIIVLFPGPEMDAISREGRRLVKDGFSDYFCIPTWLSLYRADQDRTGLIPIRFPGVMPGIYLRPSLYENENSMEYLKRIRREYRIPGFY